MKTKLFITGFIVVALAATAYKIHTPADLEIGTVIPKSDIKMKDAVSGKDLSLTEIKSQNGLLVFFSCNTCPYVKMYQERMSDYVLFAQQEKLGIAYINSNESYRDKDDSYEAMQTYAKDNKIGVPYLVDQNSEIADAFGATRTPEVFLFDKEGKLIYKGAIDDNPKSMEEIKGFYLRDAIRSVSKGQKLTTSSTKSIGCTIKRKAATK